MTSRSSATCSASTMPPGTMSPPGLKNSSGTRAEGSYETLLA